MEVKEFEQRIKQYLEENLSIDTRNVGGDYGSKKSIEIQLKLADEVISETWIDA